MKLGNLKFQSLVILSLHTYLEIEPKSVLIWFYNYWFVCMTNFIRFSFLLVISLFPIHFKLVSTHVVIFKYIIIVNMEVNLLLS
jgi:hypothetical protein